MSDLQKKWAKARVNTAMHAMAPPPPVPEFNELDEDRYGSGSVPNTPQDDDSSSASSMSSTGTVIPSPGRALFARPQGFPGRSLDPIPWTTYFERELFLPAPDGSVTYHAYLTSPAPPAAAAAAAAAGPGGVKSPGGGGSGGSGSGGGPLFVTHHGAGSSGLSFAVLGAEIRKRLPSAGILSIDARGHGLTAVHATAGIASGSLGEGVGVSAAVGTGGEATGQKREEVEEEEEGVDLTLGTLASDLRAVLALTQAAMHWPVLPPIILVGHSLGGAVVTEFASSPPLSSKLKGLTTVSPGTGTASGGIGAGTGSGTPIDLLGYAVLDVVEGSAMDALQSMHAYLATRPAGFDSLRDAVEWHVRSRTVRNAVSARASVPGLLVSHQPSGENAGGDSVAGDGGGKGEGEKQKEEEEEAEEGEDVVVNGHSRHGGGHGSRGKGGNKPWRWRTDLAKTQPFWEGWFGGLSKKFLAGRGGKMLLLAGTDRLDTELTIGQMQGKYALQVFPEAGHFIHEDLPEKTAMTLVDFYRRNDRSALVLPPKVSELLAQGKKV